MSFKDSLNKHYAHTQNSVKKYEVGGKVVTKKGATNDAKKGGYFDGRPHSQGGIKAVNIDNDQPIEVEGGEVVITKRAVADDTKKEFQGKMMTNKEILSKINESGGGVSFAKGGEVKLEDDEYYISDDDLNFDIDEKEFADGGTIPEDGFDFTLDELQTRVLKLIDNVTVSDGIVPWAALESVFGDQLTTDRVLQILLADGLIENYAGRDGEYVITSMGKDYLAAQATQTDANQDAYQIEEIKIEISNIKDAEKTDSKGVMKMYGGSYKKLWDYIISTEEITEQFESFGKPLSDFNTLYITIKNPTFNGSYEEAYPALQKLKGVTVTSVKFKTPPIQADPTEATPSNDFFSTSELEILNIIKEANDSTTMLELKDLNKKTLLSKKEVKKVVQGLIDAKFVKEQTNGYVLTERATDYFLPSIEEFPYFAPDAVKEYNPQVLTVETRSIEIASSAAGLKNIISEKKKIIEITSQLLQDVPVENVLERVEMSLLLDAEQQELNLLANPNLKYLNILGTGRAFDNNTLDRLIESARVEQNNIELPRSPYRKTNLLGKFKSFLDYCSDNSTSYIANWLSNFFGNWIFYAEYRNYDYALLSDINNLPAEISRVGKVTEVQGKSGLEYMYAPEIVFQGLSKVYDRVGFEVFPISYYAVNYDYADWFATTKGQKLGTEGVILPCILNIRRPLDLSFFGIEKVSPTKFFDAVYLQTGFTPEELKVSPAFLSDSTPDLEVWVYIRSNVEMLKILKESKICDGIHMYENNPAVDISDTAYETEVWITFYPEQTKVVPLYQFTDFEQGGNEMDRGWFTKSQFLKSGGAI